MLRTLAIVLLVPLAGLGGWFALQRSEPRADFVVASDELRYLDLHRVSHQHEIQVASALFEGLMRPNTDTLLPEPALAESYTVDASQRHWDFRLREGLRFSDGSPILARHVRGSWLRAMDPATRSQYITLLHVIDGARQFTDTRSNADPTDDLPAASVGIETPDERTVSVRLAQPCSYFPGLLAFATFAVCNPDAIDRAGGMNARWNDPASVVCSGAFMLERWDFKRRLLLRRNPHYWDQGSVGVETIEILIAIDPNTLLLAYETGRIDTYRGLEAELARGVIAQQAAGRRRDLHAGDRFATFFLRANCGKGPLAERPALRAALSLAIDKRAICDIVVGLGETPADTFVPPQSVRLMPRTNRDGETIFYRPPEGLGAGRTFEQRVELARRLLDESGYVREFGDRPLEIMYGPDPRLQRRVVEAIQSMWERNLGVRVELRLLERKVQSQRIRALDYDLATSDWYGDYLDPSTFLDMFISGSGQNRTGWANAEYDRLIAAAAAESDNDKRFEIFREAETLLCERELPIIPVYHKRGNFLLNPEFEGIVDNPLDTALIHRVRRVAPQ